MSIRKSLPGATLSLALCLVVQAFVPALAEAPESIRMARATWDTGWFQAKVVRQLLLELGYEVEPLRTMENREFYNAVARGDVHLWANGWFPLHERYLSSDATKHPVALVGYQARGGATSGYLVDRATAARLNLTRFEQLRDPEIARVFDQDGDGRADLIGCNRAWACASAIDEHLESLGLRETVEQVQGDYSPLMEETLERYAAGEPILFYTWTPNWTVGELVPGRHVDWLELPEPQAWPPNDIRIVANREFIDGNPAIATLLENIEIPVEDIHRQNVRMFRGEDATVDFERHALQWIERHRVQVDRWLIAARERRESAPPTPRELPYRETDHVESLDTIRVATKTVEPFVTYENRDYSGFSVDLWRQIADELGLRFEIYGVNSLAKVLDDVERGAADVATAGIGITSEREERLDFSHAYFKSGLQILVRDPNPSLLGTLFAQVGSILFSPQLLYVSGVFLLMLLVSAHAVWLFERAHNPDFPRGYMRGVGEAFWWAAVTVTTVGYGDKTPKRSLGKAFALLWMFVGYFVFAYFTASVASSFTVQELQGTINGLDDLYGRKVATVERSPAAEYLERMGIRARPLPNFESATEELESGAVDALVYDAPVLQHYASHEGRGVVHVVGRVFWEQHYGFAMAEDSELRDPINQALLRLMEQGDYRRTRARWFGRGSESYED